MGIWAPEDICLSINCFVNLVYAATRTAVTAVLQRWIHVGHGKSCVGFDLRAEVILTSNPQQSSHRKLRQDEEKLTSKSNPCAAVVRGAA